MPSKSHPTTVTEDAITLSSFRTSQGFKELWPEQEGRPNLHFSLQTTVSQGPAASCLLRAGVGLELSPLLSPKPSAGGAADPTYCAWGVRFTGGNDSLGLEDRSRVLSQLSMFPSFQRLSPTQWGTRNRRHGPRVPGIVSPTLK